MENVILNSLIRNEPFARKTIPFIQAEYFTDNSYRKVFEKIKDYLTNYNNVPSYSTILIELNNDEKLTEDTHKQCNDLLEGLQKNEDDYTYEWLIDKAEEFCKEKAIYNAIMESIQIYDSKDNLGRIPNLLTDALGVGFDNSIGHDFLLDYHDRYDYYHTKEEKISFDLEYLNKITRGGVSKKSLNLIMSSTGGGKTLAMCHMAANNLMDGKNVLYITLEMAEEKIAERIDANLMDIPLDQLEKLSRDVYDKNIDNIKSNTIGKLIIKEYPTTSAHSGHFRFLVNELKIKKNFVPDIIYIDYLNICASARQSKIGNAVNTYTYVKSIAEEIRGLAVEKDVPIFSATQTNRQGMSNSDPEMTEVSDSTGSTFTADMLIALISTEELQQRNQIMVKQLKNRYNDLTIHKRFVIGVDMAKMKLFDVNSSEQEDIMDDSVAVFDHNRTENRDFDNLFN